MSAGEGDKSIKALAKIDTGAGYSSMDDDLAEELGIDLENPEDTVTIRSAIGEEERPLVPVRIRMAGRVLDTRVTVSDREDLTKQMLIGSNDLGGFLVATGEEQLTTPDSPTSGSSVSALLQFGPPPPSAPSLLATLPLAAAFIVALRTLVGLQTFGLFAPVLLSMAFVQTGLPAGLFVFGLTIAAGLVAEPLLRPLRLPRVARLAVLLAVIANVLLAVNYFVDDPAVNASWAAAFPVVVMSVIIERFWEIWEQESLTEALKTAALTLLAAVLASVILVAEPVSWAAERAPIALGVLGAALAVVIGRYRGLRLTELARFRPAATAQKS